MSIPGLIIGIVAAIGYFLSSHYFNWYTWLNWINIPFAMLGLFLSVIGIIRNKQRVIGIVGMLLCLSIIILGIQAINLL